MTRELVFHFRRAGCLPAGKMLRRCPAWVQKSRLLIR